MGLVFRKKSDKGGILEFEVQDNELEVSYTEKDKKINFSFDDEEEIEQLIKFLEPFTRLVVSGGITTDPQHRV